MQKSLFAVAALSLMTLSSSPAFSGPYPFGDEPYRLDWGYDSQMEAGCLKWNWQQYQWQDICPIYVHPKAYMHPRSARAVLRTKG